jgi:hypothetical protein
MCLLKNEKNKMKNKFHAKTAKIGRKARKEDNLHFLIFAGFADSNLLGLSALCVNSF